MKPIEWEPYMGSEAALLEIGGRSFKLWRHRDGEYHSFVERGGAAKYDRRGMDLLELICHIEFVKQELDPHGQ